MIINGKRITTIASDFDGTIIKHGMQKPGERFYELVNACLDQDVFFVAASGRQYSNLYRMFSRLKKDVAYICENGSLVIYRGEVLHKVIIENRLAQELLNDMLTDAQKSGGDTGEFFCDIMVSGQNTSYFLNRNPEFATLVEKILGNRGKTLQDFGEIDEPMIKISMYFPKGIPEELAARYHTKYDKLLQAVDAGNHWFDFMPLEGNKGTALRILAEKLNLCLEETVSFGDAENDISMLKATGLSFAMGIAKEHVKACADGVCESVEDILERGLQQCTS